MQNHQLGNTFSSLSSPFQWPRSSRCFFLYPLSEMVVGGETENVVVPAASDAESKKAAKKKAKEAEKAAKKAEYKAASGKTEVQADESEDYAKHRYGQPLMIQSDNKFGERHFANVWELSQHINSAPVWVRGRVHTSRSKGKQCFLVLRQKCNTVQCLISVNEEISKQMVKFTAK